MNEPVIPYADRQNPEVDAVLAEQEQLFGMLHNSAKTYAHRPAIVRAILGLFKAITLDEHCTLPNSIKGKLGIICSAVNGCTYCTSHQCSLASAPKPDSVGMTEEEITGLVNGSDEGSDPIEAACFKYARLASFDATSVTVEVLEEMKTVLTPAQIVELATLVGLWKMTNLIHDTLHLPIEEPMQEFSHFINKR